MENQLISVIVAAYNLEACLPRCLESLVKQTYSPLEIILADDGSTDGTAKICDEYAAKYENIQAVHRKNGGLSAARNTGLSLAKGSYIGYVDGDDYIEPDMYLNMYTACMETGADMAVCAYRQVDASEEKVSPKGGGKETHFTSRKGDVSGKEAHFTGRKKDASGEEVHFTGNRIELSREEALDWYVNGNEQYHIYNSVWSKLFKRTIVEELRFPEGRKSEDIMYTTIAMTRAGKCVFLDTPYYNYVSNREGSIMNSGLHERRFHDEIPFWRDQIAYFQNIGMSALSDQAAYQFYRRMLYYFIDFKKRKMKASAKKLLQMLLLEKKEINRIYKNSFVATGDRVRMKLLLTGRDMYYYAALLYDKFIIPMRQRCL